MTVALAGTARAVLWHVIGQGLSARNVAHAWLSLLLFSPREAAYLFVYVSGNKPGRADRDQLR